MARTNITTLKGRIASWHVPLLLKRGRKMIELTNSEIQTVALGQRVLYDQVVTHTGCAEYHRAGSSGVTLTKPGKYLVSFSANIAIPTGVTPTEVALDIVQDGDILAGTVMRATPAAVDEYFNVSKDVIVDVFCGTTSTVSIANAGTSAVSVDNPNLVIRRIA